jgi:uncharacterized protein (TIGR02145 family)
MAQWRSIFNGITTNSNAYTAVSGHGNNWSWKSTATQGAYRDGTLFLPAAGNRSYSGDLNANSRGSYWSSTVENTNSPDAYLRSYYLSFSDNVNLGNPYWRANGFSVRCVAY